MENKGDFQMCIERQSNIEELVRKYKATNDEGLFLEVYKLLRRKYRGTLSYWGATTSGVNEHDILALFDDTLYKVLGTFTEGSFVKYFGVALKRSFFSLLRKLKTRRTYEMYESVWSNEDSKNTAMFDTIASDYDLENDVLRKRKADQRKLIDYLTGPGQTLDAETTAIVKAFLSYEGNRLTPTAIANQLGLHHTTIIRKLTRLAKRYDEQQFGDHRDYLLA
jgi:hypothetical protein